jgi:hypothetical protein
MAIGAGRPLDIAADRLRTQTSSVSARSPRRADSEPQAAETNSPLRPVGSFAESSPSAPGARLSVFERASMLGIPWERILLEEIHAEEGLRRYFEDVDADWPLVAALQILPFTFLRSWRVRTRIHGLSAQARAARDRDARLALRRAFEKLIGRSEADGTTLAEHLWFGYQRVLLLQRVSRAAAASRGTQAERLAFICSRCRCSYDDAVWAANREDAPRRGHRLDAAIRKVRDEGFQIPRAATEARAFGLLRRLARVGAPSARRHRSKGSKTVNRSPDSLPRRLPLPVDPD